jgi:hypothetical protein
MLHPVYLYVDGESHYLMAERTWKHLHGDAADLSTVMFKRGTGTSPSRPLHNADFKLFWDDNLYSDVRIP